MGHVLKLESIFRQCLSDFNRNITPKHHKRIINYNHKLIQCCQPMKTNLGVSCIISVSIISYVHLKQQVDREKLHDGVIRDVERQQRRKAENLYNLQQQIDITKEIKKAEEIGAT